MTWRFVEIRAPAIVPISLKIGVMFGGLLPSYLASQPWSVTHVMFRVPNTTKHAIKVICTLSGFATVERETIKWKTLKNWVKFGVAAPRPWGEHQNLNPRENHAGHFGN